MKTRSGIGVLGILIVAILALVLGALGGVVAAKQTASTKVIKEYPTASTSSPAVVVPNSTSAAPMSWADVVKRVGPAVVTIINQQAPQHDLFGNSVPGATAEGSGFLIDYKGDIVTNNHVIAQEQTLKVVLSNGKSVPARLVGHDMSSDLAVVKVDAKVPAVLSFGDSTKLQAGDPVLAIGSALGEFRNTVTAGVVSALNRSITEENGVQLQNMLQTDAAINQGNSGGPLLNDLGQVVGVNTAITRGASQNNLFNTQSVVAEGLGFAIASSTVKNVALRLAQHKPQAFLGVKYHQITQQDATYYNLPKGAYVNTISAGSPAAKSGLRTRDVIKSVDGHALTDTYQLEQIIGQHSPGDTVTLAVWRSGKNLTLKVKLGAKPAGQ